MEPVLPSLVKKNCSHPRQPDAPPAQAGEPEKVLVLICSMYASVTAAPTLLIGELSLVTPLTVKLPVAEVISPLGACAETSFPPPTVPGRGPWAGIPG